MKVAIEADTLALLSELLEQTTIAVSHPQFEAYALRIAKAKRDIDEATATAGVDNPGL